MLPGLVICCVQNSLSILLRYIWSQSEDASLINILVLALQCREKGKHFFSFLKMKALLRGNSTNPIATTFISSLQMRREEMSLIFPWDKRSNTLETRQQIRNCCLKQFLNDCRKTNNKLMALAFHHRSKQRVELIRIPSNYLHLA